MLSAKFGTRITGDLYKPEWVARSVRSPAMIKNTFGFFPSLSPTLDS